MARNKVTTNKMASMTHDDLLKQKYPAKSHARRVMQYLQKEIASNKGTLTKQSLDSSILYLEGTPTKMNEDGDQAAPFRQRRCFYYMTGVALPDCRFVYDVKEDKSTLFIPPVDEDDVIWSGMPLSSEEGLEQYDVDEVLTTDQLENFFAKHSSTTVLAVDKQVSDDVPFSLKAKVDTKHLRTAIDECRVIKDDHEIAMIRRANHVSGLAHRDVFRAVKTAKNERELEAIFVARCMREGCRQQAYESILASGTDAATLHYVRNNKAINAGTLNLLIDAGGEYNCYAADITRTFPINGRFSKESKEIYNIVLRMQTECYSMMKAGVLWEDVHARAHKVAIEGLLDLGILHNGSADEIFEARTSTKFFPHGLGHMLGMDTHDTGGHANYSDPDPMFRYLRIRGKLPAGAVVTNEPGVYFCRFILEPALKDEKHKKYINKDVLERYWQVGGVRIEDDVLITNDGYENLTDVPKSIEEMEAMINEV